MDGEERTMARKRAKHYNETTSIISIAFILFGVCSAIVLSILWPQKFSAEVFNSKLSYRLLLNIEDYLTCHKDYINFVIDEPIARDSMINFFLFNITNTINVIQRGVEPNIREIGPFGYTKFTYKYDIEFDPIDSLFVTFKEFSILTEVTDPDLCEEMYFRMDRDYLEATPCSNDQCKCKNVDQLLTIINPLFLKLLWEDSPHLLLAHYSVDVFENVKNLLDEPFTEAVQAHLVSEGMKEVYLFRLNYQILQVINTALTDLLQFYTLQQIAETFIPNNECGLQIYGIAGCPFKPFGIRQNVLITFRDIDASNYPSMLGLIDATKPYSFLNDNTAFYKYLGYIWALDVLPFNGGNGYTMVSQSEMLLSFEQLIDEYAKDSFNTNTLTANQRLGTRRILRATLNFLGITFISQYSIVSRRLQPLVNIEFRTTSDPVICAPSGEMCVWQWGYMRNVLNAPQAVSNDLAFTLIDPGSETNTNPNNFYKDLFAPSYYNSHLYCTQLLPIPANDNNFNINCTNLKFTIDDGLVNKPAGLWGVDNGVSAVNQTNLYFRFKQQPATIRKSYMYFACNMSYLLHNVYRTQTPFHDNFVVRFVNKYQDPLLNHTFTVGNWNELGIAQWGGGYITQAIAGVRTINQVVRDGMWRFGSDNLYNVLIEYASWATREGYPNTWISSVEDAKTLLFALARRDDIGVELRRLILFRGSTFIGDGVNFENGVGEVGEITYTTEANLGNFSCTGENAAACSLLNEFYASSAANCLFIQELHDSCVNQFNFLNNRCKLLLATFYYRF